MTEQVELVGLGGLITEDVKGRVFDPLACDCKPVGQRRGMCGEYKLLKLRDCPIPQADGPTDDPARVAAFWRETVPKREWFNPEVECAVAIFLNTRRFITGWTMLATGTNDTLLVHAGQVFRVAVAVSAAAMVFVHNHPSGDPTPSEADIKVTRDLIRAGQLLKIELLDSLVMGTITAERPRGFVSLRELGYFYS